MVDMVNIKMLALNMSYMSLLNNAKPSKSMFINGILPTTTYLTNAQ